VAKKTSIPRLKITMLPDDKPVKITVEVPAALHRDLLAYSETLARESGQPAVAPARLVIAMLTRFITTDRAFARSRRNAKSRNCRSIWKQPSKLRPFPKPQSLTLASNLVMRFFASCRQRT
jgi:hypothetical protein